MKEDMYKLIFYLRDVFVEMLKKRRHHSNKGYRQIKNGHPEKQMRRLAKKMGVPYGLPKYHFELSTFHVLSTVKNLSGWEVKSF